MERTTLFAEVLLPLPIKGLFTYRVPFELNEFIRSGQRVAVQFGRKKLYTALVKNIHEKVPEGYAPARACGEAKLARPELKVEIIVDAAYD